MSSEMEALRDVSDEDINEMMRDLKSLSTKNEIMKKMLVTMETINDLLKTKTLHCKCKQSMDTKDKTKLNVLNKKYIELKDGLELISVPKPKSNLIVIKTNEQSEQMDDSFAEECVVVSNVFDNNLSVEENNESIEKSNEDNNQNLNSSDNNWNESDPSLAKEDELLTTVFQDMDEEGLEYCCQFSDSKTGILCQKKFTHRQTLINHCMGHSGDKPWFCEHSHCGYRSVLRSHLIGHIRKSHTARHQFECDWPGCDFRGPSRYNVKRHKIIHTNEKPYKCDWPGCEFRSPNNKIAEHKRIHTGEKPYLCSWVGCEARFSRSFTLRNHLRTHTGEKPFKCDYPNCNYSSTQQTPLATHKRKHHNWSKESSEEVVFSDNIVSTDE